MDEEKGLPPPNTSTIPQRGGTRRVGMADRMMSFRSNLSAPIESYSQHHRKTHDSLRPPLFNSTSVIQQAKPNTGYIGEMIIPTADRLGSFRRLVGIDSSEAHTVGGKYNRPAENVGIYTRVIREEVRSRVIYKRMSILINFSLGFQIIVAAALTAIGAADGPRAVVVVLGALNTVRRHL